MLNVNKVTCSTDIIREDCDFTWVINNFTLVSEKSNNNVITSPTFKVGINEEKKFQLQLKKRRGSGYNDISLILLCINPDEDSICQCIISMIKDGQIIKTVKLEPCPFDFCQMNIFYETSTNFLKFISSMNTVTIRCEVTLVGDREDFFSDESFNANKMLLPKLNFDWMFLNKDLSDVMLRATCGKEIPAHKAVLATASPVFKAMFTHDMLENKRRLVDMIDVRYESAIELLRYIYTGGVETCEVSLVIDLLVAADKYEIEYLKNKCEMILSLNLSSENVVNVLKVADKCNMEKLKKTAVNFVRKHMNQSSDTDDVADMILSMEQLFSN
ncbi:hypothetical protein TKK_0012688 [Trichogramma kaykai]